MSPSKMIAKQRVQSAAEKLDRARALLLEAAHDLSIVTGSMTDWKDVARAHVAVEELWERTLVDADLGEADLVGTRERNAG